MSKAYALALAALALSLAACGEKPADHASFRRAEAVSMNRLWCDTFEAASEAEGVRMVRAARMGSIGTAALFCAFVNYNRTR